MDDAGDADVDGVAIVGADEGVGADVDVGVGVDVDVDVGVGVDVDVGVGARVDIDTGASAGIREVNKDAIPTAGECDGAERRCNT